jgi:hypothetical protein
VNTVMNLSIRCWEIIGVAERLAASQGQGSIEFIFNSFKVHPLCEQGYVTSCVANFKEEKSCVCMFEFPTGL